MATRTPELPRQRTAASRPRKNNRKIGGSRWALWLPLVAGIVATPFAVRYAEILPLLGSAGMTRLQLLYPFAMLVHQPQLGIQEASGDTIAQILMYAQFPLYGLLAALVLRRFGWLRAMLTIVLLHALAFGMVWLFAQM
ncbi:MAG: hypothetical protein ACR2JE_04870 [Acidobacteriaceae bacterium]